MIEAIKRIGEYAVDGNLTKDTFLNGICLKIPEYRMDKKGEQHVVFLNFNTQTKKIEIDFEKINAGSIDSGKEYLWIGNNPGPKEQMFLTTDSVIYIFTKTLPNLIKKVNGDFKSDIGKILNVFFDDSVIDPSKFEILTEIAEDLKRDLARIKNDVISLDAKKDLTERSKELKLICSKMDIEYDLPSKGDFKNMKELVESKCDELINSNIEEKLILKYKNDILKRLHSRVNKRESLLTNDLLQHQGINKDEVSIYTLKLDGYLLAKHEEYRNVVYYEKINSLFDVKSKIYSKNLTTGVCLICGKDGSLATSNATNLEFKFYMTDKIGFSSNLDGMFIKNYNICKECYQYLMIAENFIEKNLSTRIGGLKTYIVPHFIFKLDKLDLEKFSKYIKYSTNSINNLDSLKNFQKELDRYKEYEANKNNFIINYIFYRKPPSRSEFKILKLIKDVPPSRLDFIRDKVEEINNLIDDNYEGNKRLKIDLNQIWECIPIKKEEGGYSGFSRYLDIIDAIFSDKSINYNFVINQFTEVIRIIKFEREGYNIRIGQDFTDKINQLNFLLLLFIKLKLLGGVGVYEKSNINICELGDSALPKEILDYWNDVALYKEEQKRALFLLGYLVGNVGNKQSATGHKNKPILDKINFQGMGVEKLIRLSNDVLEKLKQYDLLQYNENANIYSVFKSLLDNNIASWNLSNQENVFYILSGYAFSNYIVRMRSKSSYFEELKKVSEYVDNNKEHSIKIEEIEKTLEEAKGLAEEGKYHAARELLKNIEILKRGKEVE